MKRLCVAVAIFFASVVSVWAQAPTQGLVVSSCGTTGRTYTTGAYGSVTVDTNGNLCFITPGGGGATNVNVAQWAGVALGAPSAYGTSPGAVTVPGVNAFITNTPSVVDTPQPASARHFPGCTVGVSSASCLAASTAVNFLQVQNTSASANVACAFGVAAVLNSLSSVQLTPGQPASWGIATGGVPTGQLNCIASGASTPLYVEWN